MNHWKCRSPRYPSQGPRNEQIQYWTGCSNLCHASTWVQNMLWSTLTKRNAHNGPPDQRFLHVAFRDVIWKHLVMGVEIVSFESKDLQTVWFKGLFFERWVSTMSCICHSLRSTRLSSGFSQGKRESLPQTGTTTDSDALLFWMLTASILPNEVSLPLGFWESLRWNMVCWEECSPCFLPRMW